MGKSFEKRSSEQKEMKELTVCPFCQSILSTRLIVNFYFCDKCRIAVRNERDMPVSQGNIYGKNWIEMQENEKMHVKRARYVFKTIKNMNTIKSILDVGCGTGILVDILSRNGYLTDGLDSSREAIKFAKVHKRGRFFQSTIEDFKIGSKYDLIIFTHLIEHLRNPSVFLGNIKRLLNPKGYIYIETPNLNSWCKKSVWRKRIGGMLCGRDHRILYNRESLVQLLQNNGFNIYKIFTRTYSPSIIYETVNSIMESKVRQSINKDEGYIHSKDVKKTVIKSICRKIYKHFVNSFVADIALWIPNRISERNSHGQQLIAVAEKK